MSGAVAAQAGGPTAIIHNPAGIAASGRLNAELDALAVFPRFTFLRRPASNPYATTPDEATVMFAPAKNTNKLGVVPLLAVTSDLGVPDLGVGLALYVPFGAELTMPTEGSQRHIVTEVALRAIHLTPTVAYRFWKRLRVGVGLNLINSKFLLKQRNASPFLLGSPNEFPNPPADSEGDTEIDAHDSLAFGGSFGVLYTDPDERFSLGASLMTPSRLDLRGDVNVTSGAQNIVAMSDAAGNQLPAGQRNDAVALKMPLPMIVRLGAAVRITPEVEVELDVNLQRWSTMRRLSIFFEHHYPLLPQPGAEMHDVVLEQAWRDTMSVRLGTEVSPLGAEKPFKVRAGALYDQSPIDDRHFDISTPDSDKFGLSAGAGYAFRLGERATLGVDLAYLHLFFAERDVAPTTIGTELPQEIPGSDRTILNKPAPSFFHGITRASVDLLALGVSLRM